MRQLITTDSGRLSNTKFWSFIGCGTATWIVIYLTCHNLMTWEIFVGYLGTVGGFSQISKWLSYKYGVKTDIAPTTSDAIEIKKCPDCKSKPEEPGD